MRRGLTASNFRDLIQPAALPPLLPLHRAEAKQSIQPTATPSVKCHDQHFPDIHPHQSLLQISTIFV